MSKRQKRNLKRIITAFVIFIAGALIPDITMKIALQMIAYLTVGYDVLLSAVRKIFRGNIFDEGFLMTLATVGAIIMQEFSEAAMVMLLFQTGELFQGIAVGKSRKSIKELMKIKPEFATVLRDGEEVKLPPEKVEKGELIIVLPGERVPLDGIIEEGTSSFDSSSLTGESIPVNLGVDGKAISGMINLDSPVKIRVSGVYAESTIAKILHLVENSAVHKSQSEKFITKFSRRYTPLVLLAAVITAFLPPLAFGASFSVWIRRALVFLVVSCPCALVISVPLSFFGGIGAASKRGILIKGSSHLEMLSKVNKIAFDKTGTLTCGGFFVTKIMPQGVSEERLMEIAALGESFSTHPIALSIINAYGKAIDKTRVSDVVNMAGLGIKATIDSKEALLGNIELIKEQKIDVPQITEPGSIVYIAYDKEYIGAIVLADEIKPDSKEAIETLKENGIRRTVMLTGDNMLVAQRIGEKLLIDEIHASLMPSDKVEKALSLKEDGEGKLAFAGDGINDAPVLSCVDVGIAMGALGSDAAIEAADVVIMNDSLMAVNDSIKIARKTMRIVRQNIIISLVIKFGVMVLSTLGFDNMYAAIFADVGVMVLAVLNAMRTLRL